MVDRFQIIDALRSDAQPSASEVARNLGVAIWTVCRHARRAGIELPYNQLTKERQEYVADALRKDPYASATALQDMLCISDKSYAARILNRAAAELGIDRKMTPGEGVRAGRLRNKLQRGGEMLDGSENSGPPILPEPTTPALVALRIQLGLRSP